MSAFPVVLTRSLATAGGVLPGKLCPPGSPPGGGGGGGGAPPKPGGGGGGGGGGGAGMLLRSTLYYWPKGLSCLDSWLQAQISVA